MKSKDAQWLYYADQLPYRKAIMTVQHPVVSSTPAFAIQSLLETDFYKFTMLQCFWQLFPNATGRYKFKCRKNAFDWTDLVPEINRQLDHLCTLRLDNDELAYLAKIPYFSGPFLFFLKSFQLSRELIKVEVDEHGELQITAEGPLVQITLFEIYVLATVNEIYFNQQAAGKMDLLMEEGHNRLSAKIKHINEYSRSVTAPSLPFEVFDFGLRRRFSREWHDQVVGRLAQECSAVKGTSNVYLAKKYGLVPIGTNAHEYYQVHQAMTYNLQDFQTAALDNWVRVYRGNLGIALTDIIGIDAFLKDFDLYFVKLYDGVRHDSGDPVEWGNKVVNHYKSMKVDPRTKRLVFSDGLTVSSAIDLHKTFCNQALTGFGIGTSLTNDVGIPALNIVFKIVECNGQPVAKLSDSEGKTMCEDPRFVNYLKSVFNK